MVWSVPAKIIVYNLTMQKNKKKKTKKNGSYKSYRDKRTQFVLEYIVDFNGTQAAIRAGYSKHSASEQASYLLTIPKIQAELQEAIKKRAERTERTADEVVRAYWEMAELDISNFVKVLQGGEIQAVPLDEIPPSKRKYINKLKNRRTIRESSDGSAMTMVDNIEYEIPEKKGVYDSLAKHYGLLTEVRQLQGPGGGPIKVDDVAFSDTERAARLVHLLETAAKRRGKADE